MSHRTATVTVVGGGVVGVAVAHALARRGVDTILLESAPALALAASGTNSGCLHTGFDSKPGELETEMILRTNRLREDTIDALGIPVLRCGAVLTPRSEEDRVVIDSLAANAAANGVDVTVAPDGSLMVPGEWITDPVRFASELAASAVEAGARIEVNAPVVSMSQRQDGRVDVAYGDSDVVTDFVVNCAGLYADEVASMLGDDSFRIYPRKGEFFVFALPDEARLERIVLPVPTTRTKGVLVFPTVDGHVVAGPTAHDQDDKEDWTVRPSARDEILSKAVAQAPVLEGLEPIAEYAGLRPAGVDSNYIIRVSESCDRLVNVAAIRSTGLSASLGIGEYVSEILSQAGVEQTTPADIRRGEVEVRTEPWWTRTASHRAAV